MSSRIVVEALALVTWWGLGRVTRGLRRPRQPDPARAANSAAGSGDPLRAA